MHGPPSPRYRIRWDDGRESIYAPAAGALRRIEPARNALAMATSKQRVAAKRNVKKAQAGAKEKQTLKSLPKRTRTALGKEAAAVRRGDAPTRKALEEEARRLDIRGRSKMGKAELKRAVSKAKR